MDTSKDRIYQRYATRSKGRPRGRFFFFNQVKTIIKIADQYGIHPQLFAKALRRAWKHQTSHCVQLTIRRRDQTQNTILFLINHREQIVAQISITMDILQNIEYYLR